jgi:LacI family transcriptional regulator
MLVPEIEWAAMVRREAGLRSVLSRAKPKRALRVVKCGDEGYTATQTALGAYVVRHGLPDTIVGGNDQMAIAAMKFFLARGLVAPRDIRITGFNGFEVWRYSSPELTTVFSPAYDMAATPARPSWRGCRTGVSRSGNRCCRSRSRPTARRDAVARSAAGSAPLQWRTGPEGRLFSRRRA